MMNDCRKDLSLLKYNFRPLTKREKYLLSILIIITTLWIVFKYFFKPQIEKIYILEEQIMEYNLEISKNNKILREKDNIKTDKKFLQDELEQIVSNYFPNIDQSQIIYFLNDVLVDQDINTLDLIFSKPAIENIKGINIEYVNLNIPFKGTFDGVCNIIKSIESTPWKIIIDEIQLYKNNTDNLDGSINLKIYEMGKLTDIHKNIVSFETKDLKEGNPFIPYDGYNIIANSYTEFSKNGIDIEEGSISIDTLDSIELNKEQDWDKTLKPKDKSSGYCTATHKEMIYYKVKPGDTIIGLSRYFYGTEKYMNEILEINNINADDILQVGEILLIKKR